LEEGRKLSKFEDYFPTQDDVKTIQEKYKSLIKTSQDRGNLGKVMHFRVVEAKENFYLVKSLDAEKKSKNIVAILPKALVGKFFQHSLTLEDCVFEGLVLEFLEEDLASLPVISSLFEHLAFKAQIPASNEDFSSPEHQSFFGFVSHADRKGVTVRFLNGLKKTVLVKDLETV
jgi:hypothetical protein